MQVKRGIVTFCASLVLASGIGCHFNVSTASLGALKLAKDKDGKQPATTFSATDTIFGIVPVANNPDKVKVKGQLVVVNVPGQTAGPIKGLEATLDVDGSADAFFNFSPPTAGWPNGSYRLDVVMLNSDGQQKDQKSATFTVSGGQAAPPAANAPAESSPTDQD